MPISDFSSLDISKRTTSETSTFPEITALTVSMIGIRTLYFFESFNAAGNKSRSCVITATESVRNAASNCDDVFQRSAKLYTVNIIVGVYTHIIGVENILNVFRGSDITARRNDSRRKISDNLLGVSRA